MAGDTRTSDDALDAALEVARAAWPGIEVSEEAFLALLATHASGPSARPIAELPIADLWLALACARGDAGAVRALEATTFPGARAALGRMGLSADEVTEVLQVLRERFLVADPGEAPRILAAAAHGDLPGIVRVAAVRTALNLRRRDHRYEAGDERLVHELCPADDPELAALKEQHRAAFKSALEDALATLAAQDRNVLRMHLLHGLSIDAIGGAYQVHRATAARWLGAIREKLDRETRRLLHERRGLTDPEVDSLVRLVESRVEVSFRRVLASSPGEKRSRSDATSSRSS
ncbi:putative DNA-binding regulatory protein [Minicystis rosea]|nr:putative DNA-binding regulatory protein [Minicystis rosea]